MSNFLENPFREKTNAKPNPSALGELFLSPSDSEKQKRLEKPKNQSSEFGIQSSFGDISLEEGMSPEERRKLEHEKELRNIPKQIIAWAEKYNLGDEKWVEENFEFKPDGSVICNTNLGLRCISEPDFPEYIKHVAGYLVLDSLTSAQGLNLPNSIGGDLSLHNLTSAQDLNLPQSIGGSLNLKDLTSAQDLNLPQSIGRGLYLSSLTSAQGLNLPNSIGGDLNLSKLTSAQGLNLPQSIGGGLDLSSLTSAQGLILTDIKGFVYLDNVPESEKQELREKYPKLDIR